jgi:hypothetical protein
MSRLIADAECHVLSAWVDSTSIYIQPASRIIPSTMQSHNRGTAGASLTPSEAET